MYWKDVAYLCVGENQLDALRKPHFVLSEKREVFCNNKGVKRNEFYQAAVAGFKPELCIEIKTSDYGKETHVEFDGTVYRIIRTYPTKNENTELICTTAVNANA